MISGYKLISLENKNIDSTGATTTKIDNIYNKIESSYRKSLVLTDIVIDQIEKNNMYANVYVNEAKYNLICGKYTFEIANDNTVKCTVSA